MWKPFHSSEKIWSPFNHEGYNKNKKTHKQNTINIPVEKKSTENMPSRISVFMVACWFEFSSLVIVQVVHTTEIVPKVIVSKSEVFNEAIGTCYK